MRKQKQEILLVEDDRVDRMSFERFAKMEMEFPFNYRIAGSVIEACDILENNRFSAVIIDYSLGDGTAFDLFNKVNNTPIIMITGVGSQEIAVKAMRDGAYDYLVKDVNGEYLKALPVTVKNAISRKQMEEDLKRYRKEIEEKNKILKKEIEEKNILYKQLEDRTVELETLIRAMSHDLKGPLVILGGYSLVLDKNYKDKLDEKGKNYLDLIRANVLRMEALINDLLELSQIGKVIHEMEFVNVEKMLYDLKDILDTHLTENNIVLNIDSRLPVVYADRKHLIRVFDNLIRNAIKFMGEQKNPIIEVRGIVDGDGFYKFYVRDNGIGIDEKFSKQIFQEFFRLNKVETEGTGIGLAIVKRIIQYHNGKIWVESTGKGMGSTFFFTLPG